MADALALGVGERRVSLIRLGHVVAVLPRSHMAPVPPGIVCVPVTDAGTSRMVLARRENDHRGHVTAFIKAARQVAEPVRHPLD